VSLRDSLNNIQPAPKIEAPAGWRPAVEFDGEQGTATTTGLAGSPNFDDFLREVGYDPEHYEVIGNSVRTSKWQRYDGEWLTSYRFRFRVRVPNLDLPLVWANAKKKSKQVESVPVTGRAMVVALSDFQIGKVDEGNNTEDLIARVFASYDRIEAQFKRGKYERIILVDVGDIIEGFSNAADMQQLATNDLSVMQQVDVAVSLIWEIVQRACKYAPVTYVSIASNHCQNRFAKQRVGRAGRDDWGVFVAQQINRLKGVTGLPVTVSVPQPDDESLAIDVFGDGFHILGVVHGHQAGRPEQMPDWWRKQVFGQQPISAATTLLHGHWHHLRVTELGKASNGGSRFLVMAKTMDSGSNWWRLTAGEQSTNGVVCFDLVSGVPFAGSVYVF
jgi:hypothetical protein